MIGHLRGTLIEKQPPWLLVEVAGVGYEVEAPLSVFWELPANGEAVFLVTHLLVKEDSHSEQPRFIPVVTGDEGMVFRLMASRIQVSPQSNGTTSVHYGVKDNGWDSNVMEWKEFSFSKGLYMDSANPNPYYWGDTNVRKCSGQYIGSKLHIWTEWDESGTVVKQLRYKRGEIFETRSSPPWWNGVRDQLPLPQNGLGPTD